MTDITQLLVNSSGAIVVTFLFIRYLEKWNDRNITRHQIFNDTIQGYLLESIRVKQELAAQLQNFADASREQKDVIESLYLELIKKSRVIKRYEKKDSN